jgi:toxin ParE1/3/4
VKPVLFHSEATAELEEAIAYYEQRRPGLGAALLDEVQRAASLIEEFPHIGAPYKITDCRHYVLRRFPYVLFYLELPDALWIVAVAHSRRRPGYWRHRTPEPPTSEPPAA